MRIQLYFCVATLIAILLSGCSDQGYQYAIDEKIENPYEVNLYSALVHEMSRDRADEQDSQARLSESSKIISDSMQELAKIERAVHSEVFNQKVPDVIHTELREIVTLDWTGPVETILNKLAKNSGLKYRKIGAPSASPVMVSVLARQTRLTDVIRDIAYQVQNHASIQLTADKTLELRYYDFDSAGS